MRVKVARKELDKSIARGILVAASALTLFAFMTQSHAGDRGDSGGDGGSEFRSECRAPAGEGVVKVRERHHRVQHEKWKGSRRYCAHLHRSQRAGK